MKTAKGKLEEVFLDGSARISCPPELVPAPGQYLLAYADGSDFIPAGGSPLAVPLFPSFSYAEKGFRSAPPVPYSWRPGDFLILRGPLGHGFVIPPVARKVALAAFENSPAHLMGLISLALKQNAEIVLVSNAQIEDLPEVVEVQPLQGLIDTLQWADYAAMDVNRENLDQLKQMLAGREQVMAKIEAQVLIHAPMPCGALADCGICALPLHHDWMMICKDGPVFELKNLL